MSSSASFLQEAVRPAPGCDAAAVAWRYRGKLHLTAIAKATFTFVPDGPMSRAEPRRIAWADEHHGRSPAASVRLPSDVAPRVPRAQVLVAGSAYSHSGPTQALTVRLGLFSGARPVLHKELRVQDTAPFSKMPIVYERAYGGFGCDENPLGQGADGEPADLRIVHPTDPAVPAGLGALGASWPARRRRLGDTPRRALDAAIAELPDAFDWAYFVAVPEDQQLDEIRGDEWLVMDGLTADVARLRTCLPRARAEARVFGLASRGVAEGQSLPLRADTLIIDSDARTATVVWRNDFELPSEEALSLLAITCGVETYGAPVAWPEPPRSKGPRVPVAAQPDAPAPDATVAFLSGTGDISAAAPTATLAVSLAASFPEGDADALPFLDAIGPSPMAFSTAAPAPRPMAGTGTLAAFIELPPLEDKGTFEPLDIPPEPPKPEPARAESPRPKPEERPREDAAPKPAEDSAARPDAAAFSPVDEPTAMSPAPAPVPRPRRRPKPKVLAKPRAPTAQVPGAPASIKLGLYGGFGS